MEKHKNRYDTHVNFETAKLAKEKGFPQEPNKLRIPYYNHKGVFGGDVTEWLKKHFRKQDTTGVETVSAPTQSSLQKWLRDEHRIELFVFPRMDEHGKQWYSYKCLNMNENNEYSMEHLYKGPFEIFATHEESLESALVEGMELIHNKIDYNGLG